MDERINARNKNNLDKKILKLIKKGIYCCFFILLISILLLVTYLFFIHSLLIYQIGLLVFQLSIYFAIYFIISGITVDSIVKRI